MGEIKTRDIITGPVLRKIVLRDNIYESDVPETLMFEHTPDWYIRPERIHSIHPVIKGDEILTIIYYWFDNTDSL